MAHLAEILCTKPEFQAFQRELVLASLLHDAGSPPFSHCAEHFQEAVFGKGHEAFVEDILDVSEVRRILKRHGVLLSEIAAIIRGRQIPLGKLINGSIDLDNLDNSLRFGLSGGILDERSYDPEHLALAFGLRNDEIFISRGYLEDIERWEDCRRKVYEWIYDDRNLAPGMMIVRALEFAFVAGELSKDFFYLTESEAFSYLIDKCNSDTGELITDALQWRFFVHAGDLITSTPSSGVQNLCSGWGGSKYLADCVADGLRIPGKDVCVYIGKDKGFKKVELPLVDENGVKTSFEPRQPLRWIVRVYIDPRYTKEIGRTQAVLDEILVGVPASGGFSNSNLE